MFVKAFSGPSLRRAVCNGMKSLSSDAGAAAGTDAENRIKNLLSDSLQPTKVKVTDISGGCGSMYDIAIESPLFKGKSLVAQHKLVNEILKSEIKDMHGLTLKTKAV